jgi:23S rRNA pseudouridine1911/1915/1917 synthase
MFTEWPEEKKKQIRTWLKFQAVTVNGRPVTQFNHPLSIGDSVAVRSDRFATPKTNLPSGIQIFFEDAHLLVISKPENLLSIASEAEPEKTAYFQLTDYLRQSHTRSKERVWIVHRLDRDTRRLVLVPKHKEAEKGLHTLFRERRIRKVYRALTPVWGPSPDRPLQVVYRIRDELDWRGKAQKCATTVLWEANAGELWSWLVLPHTGRTHQIRKHFARYLLPLDGDVVYSASPGTNSLGLCCIQLRFLHPMTGKPLELQL